jgi:hypothetical protein
MQYAAFDQRATYSVGFYAAGEPDNKWHGVQVKTKRRGVRLTYREGYLSEVLVSTTLSLGQGKDV